MIIGRDSARLRTRGPCTGSWHGSEGVRHDYCDRGTGGGEGEPRFINNSRRAGRNMARPPSIQGGLHFSVVSSLDSLHFRGIVGH